MELLSLEITTVNSGVYPFISQLGLSHKLTLKINCPGTQDFVVPLFCMQLSNEVYEGYLISNHNIYSSLQQWGRGWGEENTPLPLALKNLPTMQEQQEMWIQSLS